MVLEFKKDLKNEMKGHKLSLISQIKEANMDRRRDIGQSLARQAIELSMIQQ